MWASTPAHKGRKDVMLVGEAEGEAEEQSTTDRFGQTEFGGAEAVFCVAIEVYRVRRCARRRQDMVLDAQGLGRSAAIPRH